nr:NTP transferase domain-containing protein [Pseudonocardia sp. ICBG601]
MRVNAVIQARTGSTRLPGKVLTDLGGTPVLDRVVAAARAASGVDRVVVATSTAPGDDAVAERAATIGVPVVRGSEDDVLARFVQAVDEHPCDAVVRLTADCPLLDPALVSLVAATWRSVPEQDYVATTLVRTLPRGLDVELARVDALRALAGARDRVRPDPRDVGPLRRPGPVPLPRARRRTGRRRPARHPGHRRRPARPDGLVEALDGRTGWRAVVDVLRSRPDLVERNAHVRQKSLAEG